MRDILLNLARMKMFEAKIIKYLDESRNYRTYYVFMLGTKNDLSDFNDEMMYETGVILFIICIVELLHGQCIQWSNYTQHAAGLL